MTLGHSSVAACTPETAVSNAAPSAESAGPLRRPHRKSRQGCRRCKTRRVKCDESRPACGNCYRLGILCDYFNTAYPSNNHPRGRVRIVPLRRYAPRDVSLTAPAPTHQHEPEPPAPAPTSASSITSHNSYASYTSYTSYSLVPVTVGTPADRLLELRLFHHFHTMTTELSQAQNIWSTWIVEVALRTPSVMDAVLGFSAFHIRRSNDFDRAVREASYKYMARAIRSHTEQLHSGINESNAAPIIAACAILLFHGSVNQIYLSAEAEHQLPLHWFRPFQFARAVFFVAWPWVLDTGNIGHRLERLSTTQQLISQGRNLDKFNFLLDDLHTEGLLDQETMSAYTLAVANLSCIYCSPQYTNILRFPAVVSSRFIDLLEAKDPRTLAIVGYFFMLLKIARPLWWVDGVPEREFTAIMAFLPRDWWPLMGWAIQEFGWSEVGLGLKI
ncbi:hypothetical protein BKA56DRAFT_737805 [Ilyonectria sp. MPI-CAGE-AT-0026]|nr:hypothetical protein BKA56DRAFT_737805 [Ilyonectria sp. MPI-CAGE-AT-0026]